MSAIRTETQTHRHWSSTTNFLAGMIKSIKTDASDLAIFLVHSESTAHIPFAHLDVQRMPAQSYVTCSFALFSVGGFSRNNFQTSSRT